MTKVLVVQGAGMDQRGKTQVEIFGPQTLGEINAEIEGHATSLGLEVEIFQSNDEADVVRKLAEADPSEISALLINPAGFTTSAGPLCDAVAALAFPAFEVHASNPAARGVHSVLLPVCKGAICGFGYAGYRLALEAINQG